MATGTRPPTPPRKPSKPTGTMATSSRSKPNFSATSTGKSFPQSDRPKLIDRNQLIEIITISAQSPVGMPDACLDALADAAMQPRDIVKTYYKRCWERMCDIYRTIHAPPLPDPSFDDIDPGF